jgi:hypothetical protein
MNKIIIGMLAVALTVAACKESTEVSKNDPLESGRGFIESSLKGNYDEAKKYLLPDSTNMQYFEGFVNFNSNISNDEKEGFKNANIIIDSTQQLSDSVTIITYSNTFKNKPSKLKLVKKNNEWLVDFKYTFINNL